MCQPFLHDDIIVSMVTHCVWVWNILGNICSEYHACSTYRSHDINFFLMMLILEVNEYSKNYTLNYLYFLLFHYHFLDVKTNNVELEDYAVYKG